jgi:transposase InsO family protein
MRYRFIEAEKATYPIEMLCRVLTVARSGYYAWCRRPTSARAQENVWLGTHLRACYHEFRGRYGSPRLHRELQGRGIRIGRHRVARLMRVHGLRSLCRRRARQGRSSPVASGAINALQREFTAQHPNQKWAGDITYIATREGWLYLAVLLDLYSRRIVGWAMGPQMGTGLTVQALEMALQCRRVVPGLLHHSDRGSQYAAAMYQQRLAARGIACSMSRPGNCWDNAVVESFFATLKSELVYLRRFQTRQEAKNEIFEYLEGFYNRQRRHSTLGYLSPVEFEERTGLVIHRVH